MTDFSYQLYSSRNFPPLEDTLKMLAVAGYAEVEGVGSMFDDPGTLPALRDTLDANGLRMSTTHAGLDMLQSDPDRIIEAARVLGIQDIYVPYLAEENRPGDAQGWADFGKTLSEAAKPIVDAGLLFGWHNHDFEFADLGGSDRPIDLLLAASDAIHFEFDLAWGVRAGIDPAIWVERYGSRISSAHLKDIAPAGECTDEDGWADLGYGVVDWSSLLPALIAGGTKHFVMEHDNPNDHQRFAKRSIESARKFAGASS